MVDERVFCLKRDDLKQAGLLVKGWMALDDVSRILKVHQSFIPRSIAEQDENWKQLIPYQLITSGKRILVFQRGSGVNEKRLVGRLSAGIGGHINDHDAPSGRLGPEELLNSATREREEELIITTNLSTKVIGIINDDSDAVGRVHIGVVIECRAEDPSGVRLRPGAEDLSFQGWLSPSEILSKADQFEPWSIFATELLEASMPQNDL